MKSILGRLVVLTMLALPLTACGGDDDGVTKPRTVDLSGNYELISYWEAEVVNALLPPLATGTLALTANGYDLTITLPPSALPPMIEDEGTYLADEDNQITLTSGGDIGQLSGTYTFDPNAMGNGVLSLDVEGGLERMVTYWKKL